MTDAESSEFERLMDAGDHIAALCLIVKACGGQMTMHGEPVDNEQLLRESVSQSAAWRMISRFDKLDPKTGRGESADIREGINMRALSLSQPWCWAILHGGKRVENRKWRPAARLIGTRIALHAAKSWDPSGLDFMKGIESAVRRPLARADYLHSAIVGVATLERVVERPEDLPADQRPWFVGPFGWVLSDVVPLRIGVEVGGALGLWPVPELVAAAVKGILGEAVA